MRLCKQCGAKLPLSRQRSGFCAPDKAGGKNCSEDYAKEHGLQVPLPRLFDAPDPGRPQRIIDRRKYAMSRRHGRDRRNE